MDGNSGPYALDLAFFKGGNKDWSEDREQFLCAHPLIALQQQRIWADITGSTSPASGNRRESGGSLETSPGLFPFPYFQGVVIPDEEMTDIPAVKEQAVQYDPENGDGPLMLDSGTQSLSHDIAEKRQPQECPEMRKNKGSKDVSLVTGRPQDLSDNACGAEAAAKGFGEDGERLHPISRVPSPGISSCVDETNQNMDSVPMLDRCLAMWNQAEAGAKEEEQPAPNEHNNPEWATMKVEGECCLDQGSWSKVTPLVSSQWTMTPLPPPMKPVIAPLVRCPQPMPWSKRTQPVGRGGWRRRSTVVTDCSKAQAE